MKLIVAVIRPSKLDDVIEALSSAGVSEPEKPTKPPYRRLWGGETVAND